jgi:hypothetical protein
LLTGNFESGWISREARWTKADPIPYPAFDRPMWLGKEPVEGKTILVHVDEGLGDTIQFARYLPMLSARGARVILVVESPAQKAAGRALRRFPVSSFPGRRSSGVRHALPNRQPSPGVRNAP